MYRSMIQATQNDFIDQGQLQVRSRIRAEPSGRKCCCLDLLYR